MRKDFARQRRMDCRIVTGIELNLQCRDEMIPILAALKHIYSQAAVRDEILALVAADVNRCSRRDRGRRGLDYWQIVVLAAVRLGCNFDYDKLQDLAEQHRTLRQMMGLGDWDDGPAFGWRRIRDTLCLLRPETIERINHLIVAAGHHLAPATATTVRADSFVVETNIHYPTESSLIYDGLRKVIELCVILSRLTAAPGWRQHAHLLTRVKRLARNIGRISSRKGANYQQRLRSEYQKLLSVSRKITKRARALCQHTNACGDIAAMATVAELQVFLERTEHVMHTATRRVIRGEQVPNEDKLFSIFEPHTQLYKRGKAGEPVQFGRLVIVYEDGAGFITHYHLLPRDAADRDIVVEQTRIVQQRLDGKIQRASFDRGFHSPENQQALAEVIEHPCLPMPGTRQSLQQERDASVQFRQARQSHPGVESAIGALQAGNGLQRCRDRSERGFERYLGLGILGRNLHMLGKLLIAREDQFAEAARSERNKLRAA